MLTLRSNTNWTARPAAPLSFHPLNSFLRFADSQKPNQTLWWFISLMIHGNLVLAVPAVLIYYFQAPVWVVGVTVLGFFINLVANMGGSGIRATLTTFFSSVLVNIGMLLYFIFQ